MTAWCIDLQYLTPFGVWLFIYIFFFKSRSEKRAVKDSNTSSALKFQDLSVGCFFLSPKIPFSFLTLPDFFCAYLS